MNKCMRIWLFAAFFLLAICLAGHQAMAQGNEKKDTVTMEQVEQEVADAAEAIKDYSAEQRDEATKEVEEALRVLDDRMQELQASIDAQWDDMSVTARKKARQTMDYLSEQRNKVAEWYGGLRHGSDQAWEEMKMGFSNAWGELEKAWSDARQEYGKST